MSVWTHVAAVFRIDSVKVGVDGPRINGYVKHDWDKVTGKAIYDGDWLTENDYEQQRMDRDWQEYSKHPDRFMPTGSEGSLQRLVWVKQHRECTLDRIDTDGDYEPSNCRWVSHSVQMRNRRHYRNPRFFRAVELISDDGSVLGSYQSIVDASEETGCTQEGIQAVCSGRQKTTSGMRWQYATD